MLENKRNISTWLNDCNNIKAFNQGKSGKSIGQKIGNVFGREYEKIKIKFLNYISVQKIGN